MKQKLWLTMITCMSHCVDKELYKAIDYLREQVRVLVEQQEKQNKRIILTNSQRMRVAAKAKDSTNVFRFKPITYLADGVYIAWCVRFRFNLIS